jgi:hypothetical protein
VIPDRHTDTDANTDVATASAERQHRPDERTNENLSHEQAH